MKPELIAALKAVRETEDWSALDSLLAELEKLNSEPPSPDSDEPAAASDGSDDPEKDKPVGAEGSDTPADDPEKDKPVGARAKATAQPSSVSQSEVIKLAQKVAELEKNLERERVKARIAEAGDRIPDTLKSFAMSLSPEALETFIAGLPEPQTKGIRASSKATRGDSGSPDEPSGELPPEDKKTLDRVFAGANLRDKPVTRVGPRIQATHLYKKG